VKQTGYYCCKPCFQRSLVNTSNSDDSEVMQMALNGAEEVIDIHHAGTAMRFLTAYFAVQETERLLNGIE
jgi:3-phosphoshikimate 1-carboxyvinyltransferase